MPTNNVFRWLDGRGWLILSGGDTASDEIRAVALARAAADGGIAYVTVSGNAEVGERVLEDMEDLGAPSGFLVNATTEDDQTLQNRIAEAGMVVIEGNTNAETARSVLLGAAVDGIQKAYENGAVILAERSSAMAFGGWLVRESGDLVAGLEWVEAALIAPGIETVTDWARPLLQTQPAAFAVGIGVGSALALGSAGQVEILGQKQVSIALGSGFVGTGAADTADTMGENSE